MASAAVGLRVIRAVPFATVCLVVSAFGHRLAGGGDVPLTTLALGFLAVLGVATLSAGRERSLPGIAAGLLLGQLGLHLMFHQTGMSDSAMASMNSAGAMAGTPGHLGLSPLDQLAARLLCGPLPAGMSSADIVRFAGLDPNGYSAAAPHSAASWQGITLVMAAGHLLAALVAAWWLRRGEAACWRLLRLALAPLAGALTLLLGLVPANGAQRPVRRWAADAWRLPTAATLEHLLSRRGPPVLLPA
jgi:hypothetical protein